MASRPRSAVLKVTAAIEPDARGELPSGEVVVYAFSAGGRLISQEPLDKSGAAGLKVQVTDEPTGARVIVGPKLDKPDLGELLRRGAVEAHVRLDPKQLEGLTIHVPFDIWPCWFLGPRLPEIDIVRIRDELLRRRPPIPDPPPEELPVLVGPPGPGPDPAPF